MGITWRFAMPLLSTLAALVIIVHSAEENLHREHRYDMTPRVFDTRPLESEQPWRVIREDSMLEEGLPTETWNIESQDEPPLRRVGRKRKRRPPSPSPDDTDTEPVVIDRNLETEVNDENSNIPVKRRKKFRANRWTDESTDSIRPIRRRRLRRRRPSIETWPETSEYDLYPRSKKPLGREREATIQTEIDDENADDQQHSYRDFGNDDDEVEDTRFKNRRQNTKSRFVIVDDDRQNNKQRDEKSFSEFSMDVMDSVGASETDGNNYDFKELRNKMNDKTPGIIPSMEKSKEHEPIDPSTLKDLLKRSNGTSLSEILQQHNLTLADLLNGKENAISVLKSEKLQDSQNSFMLVDNPIKGSKHKEVNIKENVASAVDNLEMKSSINNTDKNMNTNDAYVIKENIINTNLNKDLVLKEQSDTHQKENVDEDHLDTFNIPEDILTLDKNDTETPKLEEKKSGALTRRRFPGSIRRKMRMRPMVNNTYKSQINRDLIALSARRYVHHHRRNVTKAKEWRGMIPLMININTTEELKQRSENSEVTTSAVPEETTTVAEQDDETEPSILDEPITISDVAYDTDVNTNIETTTITVEIMATELDDNVTEKPIMTRPPMNPSGQRRQILNNRLKRKRIKHKTSTTEAPQDDIMKNLLDLGELVSSSEYIARTQIPKGTTQTSDDFAETATELEDFMTTQIVSKSTVRSTRIPTTRTSIKTTMVTTSPILSSTEETAKIEIEEILNDTRTSAKLSKILRERNMTLSELLEHRERGSSHVHLADIFHNASREPNPPEPFLSKSLIEPISKETYPLRALLDANLHDPSIKATTVDSIMSDHINIPMIMNFGNNVNENAENMGIMSLFNNFTNKSVVPTERIEENSTLQKDSKGTPYKSTVITVSTDDDDTTRESRMLDDDQDMISWNEIFSMIRKNQKNETKVSEKTDEISPPEVHKKITLEEDVDGDGVIVLEDLKRLKVIDNNVSSGSEEKIEFNTLAKTDILETGILNRTPNSAKSVTVATASIVGLAMILFLLTYAALKWRQQRSMSHKKKFCDDKIPTPVFENRKGVKNSSSRSISPMLQSSNIYTMNTLESQNGKDSPEYMWDSLRKPFQ